MIFRRAKQKKRNTSSSTPSEKINQEMYKRNVELANKNKLLSLLHQLYSITSRTLEIPKLSQNLIQAIVTTMDFPFVGLCVLDEESQHLVPMAGYSSHDASVQMFDASKHFSKSFQKGTSPIVKAWKTKRRGQSRQAAKFLRPLIKQKDETLFKQTTIAMVQYVPLIAEKRVIGVLCVGFSTPLKDVSKFEKDTIANIISISSIALDKAKIYEELRLANLRLQELDQQKTEFLSIASHQLRTPLSIIKGYIELIQDGAYGAVTKKTVGILNDVDQSNERLVKLVDEFLNISRIEQKRTKFNFEKASMNELIDGVYKELQKRAADKGLALVWGGDKTMDDTVLMDEDKIRHVVFNFVDNAIKYSEEGSITIRATREKSGLAVRVNDEGLGFNKQDEVNFFQKFYRGQNVKGTNVNGTGLGIYVCKKFIEAHKGRVWAHSEGLGKGGEFGFWIPQTRSKKKVSKKA